MNSVDTVRLLNRAALDKKASVTCGKDKQIGVRNLLDFLKVGAARERASV